MSWVVFPDIYLARNRLFHKSPGLSHNLRCESQITRMRNPSLPAGPQPRNPQTHVNSMQPSLGQKTQVQKSSNGPQGAKSRRVRTGCLTCRERHLKCDEALPRCQNCSKSGRICKRGIRLNFIDTQTVAPPNNVALPPGAQISFQDDSREIASEYVGGFEKYPPLEQSITLAANDASSQFDFTSTLNAPLINRSSLPVFPSLLPPFPGAPHSEIPESILSEPQYTTNHSFQGQNEFVPKISMTLTNDRNCITNPEEVLLLQVFVEEVALWMESMDPDKHVSIIHTNLSH